MASKAGFHSPQHRVSGHPGHRRANDASASDALVKTRMDKENQVKADKLIHRASHLLAEKYVLEHDGKMHDVLSYFNDKDTAKQRAEDGIAQFPRRFIEWMKMPVKEEEILSDSDVSSSESESDEEKEEGGELAALPQDQKAEKEEKHKKKQAERRALKEAKKKKKKKGPSAVTLLVESNGFEFITCIVIISTTLVIGAQLHCYEGCDDTTILIYSVLENFFVVYYVIEWSLRVAAAQMEYFEQGDSGVNTLVVWAAVIGIQVLPFLQVDTGWTNFRLIPAMHFLRVLRIIRQFECIANVDAVRMVVGGMLGAFNTLFTCCCLLGCTVFLFAITAIELYGKTWPLQTDPSHPIWFFQHGVIYSCFEMMRFMTMDKAMDHMDLIMQRNPYCFIFFYGFMVISAYIILNLVTAVIVDHALKVGKDDEEEYAQILRRQQREDMKALEQMFMTLDADGTGIVTIDEFEKAFLCGSDSGQMLRAKLSILGFQEDELKMLFKVLDNDDQGELAIREFCQGMAKIKGFAQAKDLLVANKKVERVQKLIRKYFFSKNTGREEVEKDEEVTRFQGPVQTVLQDIEITLKDRMEGVEEKLRFLKRAARSMATNLDTMKSQVAKIKAANDLWVSVGGVMPEEEVSTNDGDKKRRRSRSANDKAGSSGDSGNKMKRSSSAKPATKSAGR